MMSEPPIRFTRGVPAVESFPTTQLAECAVTVLAEQGRIVLQYGQAGGFPLLREIVAREVGVDSGRAIIGNGSLQLLDLYARLLVSPGQVVYVEQPSYDRALTVLRRGGARLRGFPLAEDGPDVDAIEQCLKQGERPVLFYIIPDFQNPSGVVLSLQKRQRLASLAREYEFWIVEDIPYRRLRYRGEEPPTLFSLAPERTILLSSYSKLISPGLRVGYTIAPQPLVNELARMAEDTYINASYLNQAIVALFIGKGWLEPQITRLKALYEPRLDATLNALTNYMSDLATWFKTEGGFFVGVTLKGTVDAGALLKLAQEANLLLTDGRSFFADGSGGNFIRLPFCALTPEEIEIGIARLANVVRKAMK
ncbi:MAG: PLP-dependent aminotransferase family protein [Anaerolineae bacterium]|nr:PLP-dependent aminotransferase family protein [Anaerolineae bacterium]